MKRQNPQNTTQVALIGGSSTLGGAEIFNARLAGLLEDAGIQVHCRKLNSHLNGRPRILGGLRFIGSVFGSLTNLLLRRPDCVVVSCANFLDILAATAFAWLTRRRDIITVSHFNASWWFWQVPSFVRFFALASQRLRLFCIAPNQKDFFLDQGIRCEEQIFPNFLNYRVREKPLHEPRTPGSPIVALYVGRIVPEKRVDELAEFLAEVADNTLPIQLRLVGECDPELQHKIARSNGKWLQTEFLGRKDEAGVSAALLASDIFFSFSVSDTLPLNMLEAAAHQVPIVTRRNPVTEDVAALVGSITFIEPDDTADTLRLKIAELLETPAGTGIAQLIKRNETFVFELLALSGNNSTSRQ